MRIRFICCRLWEKTLGNGRLVSSGLLCLLITHWIVVLTLPKTVFMKLWVPFRPGDMGVKCLAVLPPEKSTRAGDTARLSKPRHGGSRGRCRIRTTDLPVSKFMLLSLSHLVWQSLVTRATETVQQGMICYTLSVPSCHATRRKHEGWDIVRLRKLVRGSRGRRLNLPVNKFAL
ncbi:hypothetical protein T265_09706 [Opisthorchis viverrini]|uniref:Uncharacterized protein n=1 Tax=Opisthorchis viverrini TaxID=6198 RepID=A0A075A434_OPIVI|nr:hypothetical protein T265_09706 [Opisthorchis viverrini]KER22139.1 hypothetical protein T265_09706 [Opisthorchis viverrini]